MDCPEISFIIPTYNNQLTISRCIESILDEKNVPFEIICVDDCSSDDTVSILRLYEMKDSRIKVITHDSNQSAHLSRYDGTLSSLGKYIWYVDGDDTLAKGSVQAVYNEMIRDPVDILHFNTLIINEGDIPEKRLSNMVQFVKPYLGKLDGEDVFLKCFRDNAYRFSLWNKLFNGAICRYAFNRMSKTVLPKAQDKYEYLSISLIANSYRGTDAVGSYEYHFGSGLTGTKNLTIEKFSIFCSMAKISFESKQYVKKYASSSYDNVMDKYEREFATDCINNWINNVSINDKPYCFDMLIDSWGAPRVIAVLARQHWYNQKQVVQYVIGSNSAAFKPHKTRTIGVYYHSLSNGGVQRVMVGLSEIWLKMGYSVIFITDSEQSSLDYACPPEIPRFVIPPAKECNKDNYIERAKSLERILMDNSIDVLIYHAWVSNILLWDLLICKSLHVSFVSHCHNSFSLLERNLRSYFASLPRVYKLVDSVIALSDSDKMFWDNFNNNVHVVINPFTFDPRITKKKNLDNNVIIWIARFSSEKRPMDVIPVMEYVVKNCRMLDY